MLLVHLSALAVQGSAPTYLWNVGGSGVAPPFNISSLVPGLANDGEVVLFTTYFGAYTALEPAAAPAPPGTAEWCNGGIPQLANFTFHAAQMARHLDGRTAADYAGFVVLDYESWRPLWNTTNDAYRNASRALARQQHPEAAADAARIEVLATAAFEDAAAAFLGFTLRTVRQLRPSARGVGYYGYPDFPYWHPEEARATNDAQLRAISDSTALYPSVYLPYKSGVDAPASRNRAYVQGTLNETRRVARLLQSGRVAASKPLPVLPYTWYRYHDGEPSGLQLLTDEDTTMQFGETLRTPGGDVEQLIVWGNEGNASAAAQITTYFEAHRALFDGGASAQHGGERSAAPLPLPTSTGPPPLPPLHQQLWQLGSASMTVDPMGPVPVWKHCSL